MVVGGNNFPGGFKAPLNGKSTAVANARKSAISRSSRAVLQLRLSTNRRVGATAAVYCAGALEYITAESLELAGTTTEDLKVKRITPRHLQLAIRGDEELDSLIEGNIAGEGVIPHIHRTLIPKSTKKD